MRNKLKYAVSAVTAAALTLPSFVMAAGGWNPAGAGIGSGLATRTVGQILQTVMQWLLSILGFMAIIAFVVAGIMYITAAGDEDRIATAKKTMTFAIVGIVVAIIGWIIVILVSGLVSNTGTF